MLIAVFDTETTGIPKHPAAKMEVQPRCIELAAVLAEPDGEIVDELELLFDPGEKLEPIITKITGLTDDDLIGKPRFEDSIPIISAFFDRATAVIAHNLPFDETIVEMEYERAGMEFCWPQIQICTVQENAELYGKRPRLVDWYEDVFGKPLDQKHRAMDDVVQLLALCEMTGVLDDIVSSATRTH